MTMAMAIATQTAIWRSQNSSWTGARSVFWMTNTRASATTTASAMSAGEMPLRVVRKPRSSSSRRCSYTPPAWQNRTAGPATSRRVAVDSVAGHG